MNVFNLIAGAGGVSEGLYLWKKYEYIAEQNIVNPTMRVYLASSTALYIEAVNFDIRHLPSAEKSSGNYIKPTDNNNSKVVCDFLENFGDFKVSGNDGLWIAFSSSGGKGITKVAHKSYDANIVECTLYSSQSGTYDKTVTYAGTKTLPPAIGDMVGYVISDKEDAYPDKAEQGGFYYERFTPFDLAKDLNCTKYVTGSFTPTGNSVFKAITHNFGTYAKFAVSWYAGWKAVPLNSAISTCFNIYADNGRGAESFVSGSSGQNINANTNVNTTSTTVCEIGNGTGGSKYYYSGREYHYIVFG